MIGRVENRQWASVIGRVEESSGGVCDREGGGIIRERLRVIGSVEESSGGVCDWEGGECQWASVIGRVEE